MVIDVKNYQPLMIANPPGRLTEDRDIRRYGNPPSYFLKRDGGFAYVISKPKKQKQVSTLQELVFIFIDI